MNTMAAGAVPRPAAASIVNLWQRKTLMACFCRHPRSILEQGSGVAECDALPGKVENGTGNGVDY